MFIVKFSNYSELLEMRSNSEITFGLMHLESFYSCWFSFLSVINTPKRAGGELNCYLIGVATFDFLQRYLGGVFK